MKRQYYILGPRNEMFPIAPPLPNAKRCPPSEVKQYGNDQYEYTRRVFPGGREIVFEYNLITLVMLVMIPLKDAVCPGMLLPGNEWLLREHLAAAERAKGYWPVREIDLPEAWVERLLERITTE